jgi:toxin ParE1/3/4
MRATGTSSAKLVLVRRSSAVEDVLNRVAAQPDLYAQVYRGVREALISGFPYCVYYREEAGQVFVLSVFHTARDPAVWQGRALP